MMRTLDHTYAGHSVSHATLRDEDLLERFVNFLISLADDDINSRLEAAFERTLEQVKSIDWESYTTDEDPEAVSCIINEELFELMNQIAPDGCCFGSHEGDGSDLGFWTIEPD